MPLHKYLFLRSLGYATPLTEPIIAVIYNKKETQTRSLKQGQSIYAVKTFRH